MIVKSFHRKGEYKIQQFILFYGKYLLDYVVNQQEFLARTTKPFNAELTKLFLLT